jgi:glycosyltransferase involved in cell wall biosynthesis
MFEHVSGSDLAHSGTPDKTRPEAPAGFGRPEILTLVGCYTPGFKAGGPIRSIENLVAVLGGEFRFRIVTLDRDLGDASPFPGITPNRWLPVGWAEVMYQRTGPPGFLHMCATLASVDRNAVLYLNSFFARRFSMLPALMHWAGLCRASGLVIAPRGEFSLGALRFKRRRKLFYIRICRWLGVFRHVTWHASSALETEDIRRQFPAAVQIDVAGVLSVAAQDQSSHGSVVFTASDLASASPLDRSRRQVKIPGRLRVVFVGRCSRMKNLAGALRLLAGVSGDIEFNIYGPLEDARYWAECRDLIDTLPPNIRVRYDGEIEHAKVWQVFAQHDLFLFPTLGENYGHVISEALAVGCPVLISDRTMWRGLEAEGVGWDIPLDDEDRFRSVLQQCVDAGDEWLGAASRRAMDYATRRLHDPATIEENRKLFQHALGRLGQGSLV